MPYSLAMETLLKKLTNKYSRPYFEPDESIPPPHTTSSFYTV
jgi:hypothetical protein